MTKLNKQSKNQKEQVAVGSSSVAGATVGAVVGSSLANKAQAATTDNTDQENQTPVEEAPATTSTASHTTPAPAKPATPIHDGPDTPEVPDGPDGPDGPETPEAPEGYTSNPEVEVLSYETVTADDGSQADVAYINMDYTLGVVIDLDRDGEADVIAFDENGDGVFDENEFTETTGLGIHMQPLQEGLAPDVAVTENYNSDYINDADVTDYMA